MRDIYYIVQSQIHNKVNKTIKVKSVVGNMDGSYVLNTCDVKWSRVGLVVTDEDEIEFKITSISGNQLTVTGASLFVGNGLLQAYKFFIGTPMQTNEEWKQLSSDERTKVPFCWMVEATSEVLNGEESSVERVSEIRLVLLDSNNSVNWLTKDVHNNRLAPMYLYIDHLKKAIENNLLFAPVENYKVRNFTRFGSETSNGFDQNIIDADLTGIEIRFSLPIYKEENCNC
jgi:hypothetical protein